MSQRPKHLHAFILRSPRPGDPPRHVSAGIGLVHTNGTISVLLHFLPTNGVIELRENPPSSFSSFGPRLALA